MAMAQVSYAQMHADEIIEKVDQVRSPGEDYTIEATVDSYSGGRAESRSATYEVMVKGADNTIIKTILPNVERGRVLLMRGHDLWGFFPDVSKPLRLSLQERLLGDVSNGDIARVNFSGDYDSKVLRTEQIGDNDCYVLELTANAPDVTYGKVILWAQVADFHPIKAEFYAISGKLLKRCSYEEYKMLGDAVRPTKLIMEDPLIKGKRSIITYENIQIGEIPEKYFTKDYMKKLM